MADVVLFPGIAWPRIAAGSGICQPGGVEMTDAAGLGELVSIAVTAQASECSMKVAAPRDFIRHLLELTNFILVFEVYPTLDAATLAFRGQAA